MTKLEYLLKMKDKEHQIVTQQLAQNALRHQQFMEALSEQRAVINNYLIKMALGRIAEIQEKIDAVVLEIHDQQMRESRQKMEEITAEQARIRLFEEQHHHEITAENDRLREVNATMLEMLRKCMGDDRDDTASLSPVSLSDIDRMIAYVSETVKQETMPKKEEIFQIKDTKSIS